MWKIVSIYKMKVIKALDIKNPRLRQPSKRPLKTITQKKGIHRILRLDIRVGTTQIEPFSCRT